MDRGAAAAGQASLRLTTRDDYSACNMTLLNDEVPTSNDVREINGVRPPVIGTVPES